MAIYGTIYRMDIGGLAIILGVILVSMTLHEAMHAFMGYFLGDDTAKAQGRLTLNPLKHIDPFMTILLPVMLAFMGGPIFGGAKPVPFNPHRVRYGEWGAALVALAGPLTNLIIAFVVFGIGVVSGVITDQGIQTTLAGSIVRAAVFVNLGFFVFNMLPIPPLDGSRVLYALAPESVQRFMEQVERYGIIIVFALIILLSPVLGSIMFSGIYGVLWVFEQIFRL